MWVVDLESELLVDGDGQPSVEKGLRGEAATFAGY
jgi:hypothetical protein